MKRELAVREPLSEQRFDLTNLDPQLASALEKNFATTTFSAEVRDKARARLRGMRSVTTPITKAELRLWVLPIVVGCLKPKAELDEVAWIDVLYLAMADVPRGLFTVAKQRWALRQIKFFPTPADIWEAIKDDWVELTGHVDALKAIAND